MERIKGIAFNDGNPLHVEQINPLMGYQIVHKQTGRILPTTQRFEIYGRDKAHQMMMAVDTMYKQFNDPININEYELEEVYMSELEEMGSGWVTLYTDKDIEEMGLFGG